MMIGGKGIQLIDYEKKQAGDAKKQWKEADAAGLTPALRPDYERAVSAAAVGRAAMEDRFGEGVMERESTIHELPMQLHIPGPPPLLLTGHPDTLVVDHEARTVVVVEVKTSDDISKFGQVIYSADYDAQAAGYITLVEQAPQFAGYHVSHVFLVLETVEPWCSAWVEADALALHIGGRKLERAIDRVATGCADGWPDYPRLTVTPKAYHMEQWK
jgi:hypothetical protein